MITMQNVGSRTAHSPKARSGRRAGGNDKEREMSTKVEINQGTDRVSLRGGRKTVVGVFRNSGSVDDVVRKIAVLGFPRNEIRILQEPERFEISGSMNFPRLDFEVELAESLLGIGVPQGETEACIQELRRGGALVFATGSDRKADAAAEVMKRNGALDIAKGSGPEPYLPHVLRGVRKTLTHGDPDPGGQSGRIPPGGSGYFSW